ncbi:unnamed protein product [Brugia timori]|uniref:Uncharacterized protein n=1 Tax=Brugia timori TaxID=42155 RepID=A0A3P7WKK3_9BILA|nr:unnamed protein product [Brugia timori]
MTLKWLFASMCPPVRFNFRRMFKNNATIFTSNNLNRRMKILNYEDFQFVGLRSSSDIFLRKSALAKLISF